MKTLKWTRTLLTGLLVASAGSSTGCMMFGGAEAGTGPMSLGDQIGSPLSAGDLTSVTANRVAGMMASSGGLAGPVESRLLPPGYGAGVRTSAFDMTRMRVMVVGLVRWAQPGLYEGFEEKGRKDKMFVQVLQRLGLPPDRLIALHDEQATKANVQAALERQVASCQPGETLLLLWSGHGSTDANGAGFVVPYDAGEADQDQWSFPVVVDTIERSFRGAGVMMAIEACYSGSMLDAIRARPATRSYGVLTSTTRNAESTGNWTFTQSLIDGITGQAFVDEDRNGQVSFAELARHARQQMSAFEGQTAPCAVGGAFSGGMSVAAVRDRATASPIGDPIKAYDSNQWWIARIAGVDGDRIKVHWMDMGYDNVTDDVWMAPSLVQRIDVPRIGTAQALEALQAGAPQA